MSTALVTGGTKKDVAAMAVLALNIRETNRGLVDEFVVLHNGIKKKDQELIGKILPTRFIRYRCPINVIKLWTNKTIWYFSPMIFSKFECLRLLNDYDRVIWSDYDVIIKGDISEILEGKCAYGTVCDNDKRLKEMFYETISSVDMQEYDMEAKCICTPLFIVKRELEKYNEYYEWCYRKLDEYMKYVYLPEQCIFTMLAQKFHLEYDDFPNDIYAMYPKNDNEKVKILHAYGRPKFWSGLDNEKWNSYYNEWLSMGGSKI